MLRTGSLTANITQQFDYYNLYSLYRLQRESLLITIILSAMGFYHGIIVGVARTVMIFGI